MDQVKTGIGKRLNAVYRQKILSGEGLQREAVWILLADELAVILDPSMSAGVIAPCGQRQTNAPKNLHLQIDL